MASEASAAAPSCCCCLCGLLYDSGDGRTHGAKFQCHACNAAEKQMRRNLGSRKELETIPEEEQKAFFRRLQDEKKAAGKYLPWKTVKAQLIALVTTRHITESSSDVTTEELPLSVWQTRGWDKETVENCPREWCETLKVHLYKVPTKKVVWREVHQSVTERILRQEQEAEKTRRKKNKKASEDDLDLPEAAPKDKDEKDEQKEEKAAAAAVRKTQASNQKKNMVAAKSIGQLSNDLQAMTRAYKKASGVSETVEKVFQEILSQVELWLGAAKSTLQLAEDDRAKKGEVELPPLPFDVGELRTQHQTCAEVIKNLKPFMPAPKPKPAPKRKADEDQQNGEAAPAKAKRVRGKKPN